MTAENDISARNLAYYGERHDDRPWWPFVRTLVSEICQSAGTADACHFLRHVGSRLAAAHPLEEQPTLAALEKALNGVLGGFEWGWVQLSTDNRSIRILHGAHPGARETAEHWSQAIAAVLEGMYQYWFQAQNQEVRLQVQCTDRSQTGALVFHCGR